MEVEKERMERKQGRREKVRELREKRAGMRKVLEILNCLLHP